MSKFSRKVILVIEQKDGEPSVNFFAELETIFKMSKYSFEVIGATQTGAEEIYYFKEK